MLSPDGIWAGACRQGDGCRLRADLGWNLRREPIRNYVTCMIVYKVCVCMYEGLLENEKYLGLIATCIDISQSLRFVLILLL